MKNVLLPVTKAKEWFVSRSLLMKVVIILVIGFIGWYGYSKMIASSKQTIQYQTEKAAKGTLIVSVSASGNALTSNFMEITTQASGVISQVYVKDGDIVTQGQKIADISLDQQGQQKQTSAWASYLSAKNNLDSAQTNMYTLQSDMFTKWEKYMDLAQNSTYENSDGSPNKENRTLPEFHIAQNDWLAAEAKYKSQQSVIAQAQSALTNAWTSYQLSSSSITAPAAGTVNNITIVPGMQLSAISSSDSSSSNTSQRVAILQNKGNPFISVNLTEIDIPNIKSGQKATVTFDSIKDKTYTGRVMTVDRIGSTSNGVTNYPITIQLDTEVAQVLPNMSASANIIIETKDNVVLVPSSAITTQDSQSTVKIMKNGQVQETPVEIGSASDTQTEVLSGISEGDTIITSVTTTGTQSASSSTQSPFSGFGGGGMRTGSSNAIRISR